MENNFNFEELLEKFSNKFDNKFMEQRKVFLWGAVHDESAKQIVNRLLYLEAEDPGKEITFYINSPGGVVTSGLVIIDAMKMISSPIMIGELIIFIASIITKPEVTTPPEVSLLLA
jgi:ATP-dependent Clp protease, protease subunit